MLSWLAGKMIARNMAAIRAGDLGPTLALEADDIEFTFPGDSSFAPGASNKREHQQWLERFAELGLQIYPDEVILKGFPWRQTICVRGHIHLDDPEDGRVYDSCASTRPTRTPRKANDSTRTCPRGRVG
jgi:hypothetical protein